MPQVKFIESKSALSDTDVVEVKAPKMRDLWGIVKLVTMSREYERKDWVEVVRKCFMIFLNKTVKINGKAPTEGEVEDWDLDFFVMLLTTLFPYFKARLWPQLLGLLESLGGEK
jgi:hypothetical protein